jgi:hypothetical protein
VKLSSQIVAELTAHTERHCLRSDDLFFTVTRNGDQALILVAAGSDRI